MSHKVHDKPRETSSTGPQYESQSPRYKPRETSSTGPQYEPQSPWYNLRETSSTGPQYEPQSPRYKPRETPNTGPQYEPQSPRYNLQKTPSTGPQYEPEISKNVLASRPRFFRSSIEVPSRSLGSPNTLQYSRVSESNILPIDDEEVIEYKEGQDYDSDEYEVVEVE